MVAPLISFSYILFSKADFKMKTIIVTFQYLSPIVRKPLLGVYNKVRHKPACVVTALCKTDLWDKLVILFSHMCSVLKFYHGIVVGFIHLTNS